jgi:hypothetical protein
VDSSPSHQNVLVALALTAYQRDHAAYPDRLDGLTPGYLKTVPKDLFSGKALRYKTAPKGETCFTASARTARMTPAAL